jgi:threonine dehydrogenase-like Zn-dependent dehydrogenase
MAGTARAFRVEAPGRAGIVEVPLPDPGPDDVVVRALHSAVSRGTETLVYRGEVPASQHERMRAPFQTGDFPGPVVYGYLSVGVVESGPGAGRTVFCLYPHQDRFVVPADAVVEVPAGVPAARAVLAGTVETAVNALWDAAPRVGDRVAVVGAGMVGASVAGLLASFPGVRVELVDVDASRRAVAEALGVGFATPEDAAGECDLVLHASASEAGLARSLELLGDEGEVVELSWYGERAPRVPLGEAFHSRRLTVRASQVGRVAPARRARRSTTDRLALALRLLADPRFDALVSDSCAFDELPEVMAALAAGERPGLAVRVEF